MTEPRPTLRFREGVGVTPGIPAAWALHYEVQWDDAPGFSPALGARRSHADSGFEDVTPPLDPPPFPREDAVAYTLQSSDPALVMRRRR